MRRDLVETQMLNSTANDRIPFKRLRILFLVPFAPSLQADHGGGRVVAQLIAHLGQKHAIGLCYLRSIKEPAIDPSLREFCEVIEEVVIPEITTTGMTRWFHRLRGRWELLTGKPLWAQARFSAEYQDRVKSILQTWSPDIVQIEFHVMGQYLPALADHSAPRILVQHEPGAETAREFIKSPFARRRLMPLLELLAWQRFERRIIRQVQTVVVFTERDRNAVARLGGRTPIVQIPLGTEFPQRLSSLSETEPQSLLFVGNFKHLPNIDAANRLINHIFPQVQAECPDVRLVIVGDNLPVDLLRIAKKNVIVTGYVPDITPYVDQATLFVVPLSLGGGMRVKVLEALAAGKAIVASSRAVEGLSLVDGEHVILAEADEEFVRAIVDLLHNPEQRISLAAQARAWASANLSWERVAEDYEKLYRSLMKC